MTTFDIPTSKIRIITKDGRSLALENTSSVLALGTFDGVHVAHRRLLDEAVALKKRVGAKVCGAWCFSESPSAAINGIDVPSLCSLEEKLELIFDCGIDFIAVGSFGDFRYMTADDFISTVLIRQLGCIGTVCGFNHRFGCNGTGTPQLLSEHFGYSATVVCPEITVNGKTVSSSAIRSFIANGQMESAAEMLGRRYAIRQNVIKGKKLGRTMGFPTANQEFPQGVIQPKRGVYATVCTLNGKKYAGVSNVGIRPTIDDSIDHHSVNCETYLIGFSQSIYGKPLKVEFCSLLREEKQFVSTVELASAIENDKQNAAAYFAEHEIKMI